MLLYKSHPFNSLQGEYCEQHGMNPLCKHEDFWDLNQTMSGDQPLFTPCFLSTVPVWVIHGWIWIVSPFYMYYLFRQKSDPNPLSGRIISKYLLLAVNILLLVVQWVLEYTPHHSLWNAAVLGFTLQICTQILVGFYIHMERWKGFLSSGILFIYWTVAIIISVVPLYNKILKLEYLQSTWLFTSFCAMYVVLCMQWMLSCLADIPKHNDKERSPYCTSSIPSKLLFLWIFRILMRGFRKPLTQEDIIPMDSRDKAGYLLSKYQYHWKPSENTSTKCCIERGNDLPVLENAGESLLVMNDVGDNTHPEYHPSHHSLLRTLIKMFGWEFLMFHLLAMFRVVCKMTSPQLLRLLLDVIADPQSENNQLWWGYILAVSLFLVSAIETMCYSHYLYTSMNLGRRVSATLMSALYKKVLTISHHSKQFSSDGEILNLMSVDTSTIRSAMMYLGIWFESLLEIILSIYFLYEILGYATFAGCGVLIVLMIVNVVISSRLFRVMQTQMMLKDNRIHLLSEVINGIKVLKLYAWEMIFKDKIIDKRNVELREMLKIKVFERIAETFFHITPFLVISTVFLTYIHISDTPLDAKTVFVSLSLFNVLKYSVDYLYYCVRDNMRFFVAFKRINTFLNAVDIQEDNVERCQQGEAVAIIDGEFAWETSNSLLKEVNIAIPEGGLVAVVGQVGQGKSSLLSAILGEMIKIRGKVSVKGSVAYVSQEAWIQNATIQENVLFGNKMDDKRYHEVLEACALIQDLDILPAGDQTEIGEKGKWKDSMSTLSLSECPTSLWFEGINLSGGQKQRVSLARAVYSDRDVYLLDDPLSAVDSHVGRHIFNEVIGSSGLLKDKTCILVTHGIQWLPKVDEIIVLVNGKISESGTYDELLNHAGPFAEVLETYLNDTDEGDVEEEVMVKVLQRLTSLTSNETNGSVFDLRQSINDLSANHLHVKSSSSHATHRLTSVTKDNEVKKDLIKHNLIEEETTEIGKVKWKQFMTYFRTIGLGYCVLLVILYSLNECLTLLGNIWLSRWTDDPVMKSAKATTNNNSSVQQRNIHFIGSYLGFGLGQITSMVLFGILCVLRTVAASRTLHANLLHTTVRCPISFFDTTPSGRIINRFSQDMEVVDTMLPVNLENLIFCIISIMGVLAAITYSVHWFLLVVIPLGVIYYLIMSFHLPSSRQLRRIISIKRSPIYSFFSETLAGASVIRAFGKENQFLIEMQRRVNDFHQVDWADIVITSWRSVHVEMLGCLVILAACMIAVGTKDNISAGTAGLSVTYSLTITQLMNWFVYVFTLVETNAVSVERIAEYTNNESEADLINVDHRPSEGWPGQGRITLSSYSTRYRSQLDLVLRDINVTIKPGEKVGIVGRTGAGKSSLTLSLFRLIEPVSGNIEIDGERLTYLGLHDCRSNLTILPQDPVLFSGTLRMNVDPMDEYTDEEIWNALEHAHLKSYVQSLSTGLDSECGERGDNFSVGQKQLVCLARSLLKKTKILILDEATAAVDLETDDLIQRTIREEFRECTVLTIAHRLDTVMDYDRIMVLDKGCVLEYDTPQNLLADSKSMFYQLVKNAGLIK
ncbi:ATP-binding cassette sub-family C member 3-like isoform X3 [Ostrea edulis]|uniref:ATP-binding cassette sub-family C member 3-like isoform X3 n=2 Tax=Ostrea edulis TaxID=37623 RepID=UPI0024AE9E66|nr:ATP-binding cassette sub-family C member 3-like isoform X3 [Ostrea edulis]